MFYCFITFFLGLCFGVISSRLCIVRKRNFILNRNEVNSQNYKTDLKRYNQYKLELERYNKEFKNKYEDDGYESYEECFSDMDLPGFDELVDVESFRINQETVFTSTVLTSIEPTNGELPEEFKLYAAYPNPFNPVTTLRYDLPEDAMVSITIYDVMGRRVKSLVNTIQTEGYRSVRWDATNSFGEPVSAGMYIYMIQAGQFTKTKKMVLLK